MDPNLYSLNGLLKPDSIILDNFDNKKIWRVYYFDEKGNTNNEKIFYSENEAVNYLYNILKNYTDIDKKCFKKKNKNR